VAKPESIFKMKCKVPMYWIQAVREVGEGHRQNGKQLVWEPPKLQLEVACPKLVLSSESFGYYYACECL